MQILEATTHVGPDGILRLAVPIEARDRDVRVAIVVESAGQPATPPPASEIDGWAPYRAKLEAAGLRSPPPGSWRPRVAELLEFDGPPVSQTLVEDRR